MACVDRKCANGELLCFENFAGQTPADELKSKKKIFEKISEGFIFEKAQATMSWKGNLLQTSDGSNVSFFETI